MCAGLDKHTRVRCILYKLWANNYVSCCQRIIICVYNEHLRKRSGNFPGISGKCRENFRRENFRGKFPGNSGKFREIPGKFPTGKFPGKLSGKIPGKFIFSSTKFVKILEIG